MTKTTTIILALFISISFNSRSQTPGEAETQSYIVDACFHSCIPQTGFPTGNDLSNDNADLMEWNGSSWIGSWPNSYLTVPPPTASVGCRAMFIGSGVFWTAPGEGFGMRLSAPLISGRSYTFTFTYISHGWGSTGSFSPILSSGSIPVVNNSDVYITNLPPAGFSWVQNSITFTATAGQQGHTWLFLKTSPDISSGMISSFCEGCTSVATAVTNYNKSFSVNVFPNPVRDAVTLEIRNEGIQQLNYEICSASGKIIEAGSEQNLSSDYNKSFDVSSLADGLYFIRIIADDHTEVKTFMKGLN
jgi:hypothetical protein